MLSENGGPYPVVPCSRAHTGQTIAVTVLPKLGKTAVAQGKLADLVSTTCDNAYRRTTGVSSAEEAITTLSWYDFEPSTAQRKTGARWLRCDLIAWASQNGQLQSLPTRGGPVATHGISDAYALCVRSASGPYLSCAQPHQYRALARSFVSERRYPSALDFELQAVQGCGRGLKKGSWAYAAPSRSQWTAGEHTVMCAKRTSH